MNDQPADRLRTPPEQRFALAEELVDLAAAAERLLAEPSGQHGHKQMALFRHGPATLALYCFDPGGRLPDHVVDGPVIIHVLAGRLRVRTDQAEHALSAGQLLRLAPGVRHDVAADEPSQMLLTVCLEGPGSHG